MFTPHLSIGTRGQGSVVVAADVEALEGGIAELKPGPRTRVVQDLSLIHISEPTRPY